MSAAAKSITAENVVRLFPDVEPHVESTPQQEQKDQQQQQPPPQTSQAASKDLAGYNEEQIRLMAEVCIVLDYNDTPIGSASKKTCWFFSLF